MPGRLIALIIKELLAVWRDKKSRRLLIVPPFIQLILFSFAATLEVKNASIAVYNEDTGRWGTELIERFAGTPTFTRLIPVHDSDAMRRAVDEREAILALRIPPDFSERILGHRPAPVQAVLDGRRSNASQIVLGYAVQIVERFNADLPGAKQAAAPRAIIEARNWFNPNLLYVWFTVPCLVGVLSTLIALSITTLTVARERELGTFDQLLVSPLRPTEILIGKTVPSLILGIAEGSIIVTAAVFVFRVPFEGHLVYLYGAMAVFVLAVIGIGLFISALAHTQQQAILGAFVFLSPAILLSGFATPIENMPGWLQTLTLANPLRYFLVIIKGVFLKAMPGDIVFSNTWPLAVIALITLSVSGWLFRRRLE